MERSWLRGSAQLLVQLLALRMYRLTSLNAPCARARAAQAAHPFLLVWRHPSGVPALLQVRYPALPLLFSAKQLKGLGCSHRPWCLSLQDLKSSISSAVKFIVDTQQIQGQEHAAGTGA